MNDESGFKKDKLMKRIRAQGFSELLKGAIRSGVQSNEAEGVQEKRILIVDDELDICETVQEILLTVCQYVEFVQNPKEALEKIKQNKYDLLIFDIQMPGFTGLQMLEHLRSQNIKTPVLFLSASSSEKNLQAALQLSASAFIEKPFQAQELIESVTRLIQFSAVSSNKKAS